ncbi:MFS transporter, partial [Mesorhizobium sp. M00.F.Ca.ET.186.01.1.1]
MLRKDRMPAVLGVLMVNIFIVMVGVGLITPILPALMKDFGASGQARGLLLLSNFALPESVSR